MGDIQKLQQKIYKEYQTDKKLGLEPNAKYLHGTPIKPVVPLDTGKGGLFLLGAYPSARFAKIDKVPDVPVADNLGPFESERWFDGSRLRVQPSAKELEDLFLKSLSIEREECWITDLVKVFLFKKGHVERYHKLEASVPAGYERKRFFELGRESLVWLKRELEVAKPSFMITLGSEVAGVLHNKRSAVARLELLQPKITMLRIEEVDIPTMHCAHPGILMRTNDPKNHWPEKHEKEFLPALKLAKKRYGF